VSLGGYYNATSTSIDFASVAGRKEIVTAGDTSGYLQLSTRANAGNLVECLRINSVGNVGIGTTAPVRGLHIESTASSTLRTMRIAYDGTYYNEIINAGAAGAVYDVYGGLAHSLKIANVSYAVLTQTGLRVTGDVTSNSFNGGQLAGLRNRIINGDMNIWQRGESLNSGLAQVTYTADRWIVYATGAAVNLSKNAGPTDNKYSMHIAGAAGNTAVDIIQRIEFINGFLPAGTVCTVSAKIYTSGNTFTPGWSIVSPNNPDDYGSSTQVDSGSFQACGTGVWTSVSFQFTTNAACQNGIQLEIKLLGTGSGVTKALTGVQLEPGSVATPFESRPIGLELGLCQRYYSKSLSVWANAMSGYGGSVINTDIICSIRLPVTMRAAPTLTTFSENGTPGRISIDRDGGGSIVSQLGVTQDGVTILNNSGGTLTSIKNITYSWTASAEL
jgi:hypothetical protein